MKEKKKQKKNKILVFSVLSLLAISLVAAVVVNYLYSQEISLEGNQVNIVGEPSQEIPCEIGFECPGSDVSIENDLSGDVLMSLSSENDEGVELKYVSELTLSQKIVDFGSEEPWVLTGDTAVVKYTLVGDDFSAEVISGEIDGYVLIYYKDNSDRFVNPATGILIGSVEEKLPYETDGNFDEYDYCETGEYDTCHGSKIWYIPKTAMDLSGNINWGQASNFLFETKLIQYNSDGEIIVYPNQTLIVTPVVVIDAGEPEGNYSSTANIGRLA